MSFPLVVEAQTEGGSFFLAARGQGGFTLELTPAARRALGALLSRASPADNDSSGETVTLEGCTLTLCR